MAWNWLVVAASVLVVLVSAQRVEWAQRNKMMFPVYAGGAIPEQKLFVESRSSNPFLPTRYKNLFGEENKVRDTFFMPKAMSDFTGRFGPIRKQTFSWQPTNNVF